MKLSNDRQLRVNGQTDLRSTAASVRCLRVLDDAPASVAALTARLGKEPRSIPGVAAMFSWLAKDGYAEWSRDALLKSSMYRITDAGRAALKDATHAE